MGRAHASLGGGRHRRSGTSDTSVRFSYSRPEQRLFQRALIRAIERMSGQPRLKRLYDQYRNTPEGDESIFAAAVRLLRLNVNYDARALAAVPSQGPVLFVANHPFGVLDGIVLTWLATQARPDTKVLAHSLLCQAPEVRDNLLPIDFGTTDQAQQTTLQSRRFAQDWLRSGHAIGIFPGGSVASSEKPLTGLAVDPPWHPFTAKLIRSARATVVPIYFSGQNSRLFHIATHTSYTLRLSLLFYETARRIGSELEVVVGQPIPFDQLQGFEGRSQLLMELRRRTFSLASRLRLDARRLPDYTREFHFPKHISWN